MARRSRGAAVAPKIVGLCCFSPSGPNPASMQSNREAVWAVFTACRTLHCLLWMDGAAAPGCDLWATKGTSSQRGCVTHGCLLSSPIAHSTPNHALIMARLCQKTEDTHPAAALQPKSSRPCLTQGNATPSLDFLLDLSLNAKQGQALVSMPCTHRAEAAELLYSQAMQDLQFSNTCSGDYFITASCEFGPSCHSLKKD